MVTFSATHNEVKTNFLGKIKQIASDGVTKPVIHLINIKQGRLLKGDELGPITNYYQLNSKNVLTETSLPERTQQDTLDLWEKSFGPVMPLKPTEPDTEIGGAYVKARLMRNRGTKEYEYVWVVQDRKHIGTENTEGENVYFARDAAIAYANEQYKYEKVLAGEAVVMSNKELDKWIEDGMPSNVASIHNPQQLGTLDQWLVGLTSNEQIKQYRLKAGIEAVETQVSNDSESTLAEGDYVISLKTGNHGAVVVLPDDSGIKKLMVEHDASVYRGGDAGRKVGRSIYTDLSEDYISVASDTLSSAIVKPTDAVYLTETEFKDVYRLSQKYVALLGSDNVRFNALPRGTCVNSKGLLPN